MSALSAQAVRETVLGPLPCVSAASARRRRRRQFDALDAASVFSEGLTNGAKPRVPMTMARAGNNGPSHGSGGSKRRQKNGGHPPRPVSGAEATADEPGALADLNGTPIADSGSAAAARVVSPSSFMGRATVCSIERELTPELQAPARTGPVTAAERAADAVIVRALANDLRDVLAAALCLAGPPVAGAAAWAAGSQRIAGPSAAAAGAPHVAGAPLLCEDSGGPRSTGPEVGLIISALTEVETAAATIGSTPPEIAASVSAAGPHGAAHMLAQVAASQRGALRAALWRLRERLELSTAPAAGRAPAVREKVERLRSASLDCGHARPRGAPPPWAIPNFSAVLESISLSPAELEAGITPPVAFFRGGQPDAVGLDWLALHGFRTLIDMRGADAVNQWVRPEVPPPAAGGPETISLPVDPFALPTDAQVWTFIDLVEDATKRPLFVYCKVGVGRMGVMIACWRIANGADPEVAIAAEGGFATVHASQSQAQFVRTFAARPANRARFKRRPSPTDLEAPSPLSSPDGAAAGGNGGMSTVPAAWSAADHRHGGAFSPSAANGVGDSHAAVAVHWGSGKGAGEGSVGEKVPVVLLRSDGFTCTREIVRKGEFRHAHPATEQQVILWERPPRNVLLLKKLGSELMPHLLSVARLLGERGVHVLLEPDVLEVLESLPARQRAMEDLDSLKLEAFHPARTVDLIVCLGGDGVMLHCSKLFQGPVPPVMGFNLGSMGFLTPHGYAQARQQLTAVLDSRSQSEGVPVTLRMRLHAEITFVESGSAIAYEVLNEMVLDRGPSPFLCLIECHEIKPDGSTRLLTKVQADGVIVSTATGSTAYSVSAGGSMVHPSVPAILMTPICPHSLSFRPVILPDSVDLEFRVPLTARSTAWVCFDGKSRQELRRGDKVTLRMSEFPMPTVNGCDQTSDFVSSLRRCLNWNEREEQKPLESQDHPKLEMGDPPGKEEADETIDEEALRQLAITSMPANGRFDGVLEGSAN